MDGLSHLHSFSSLILASGLVEFLGPPGIPRDVSYLLSVGLQMDPPLCLSICVVWIFVVLLLSRIWQVCAHSSLRSAFIPLAH